MNNLQLVFEVIEQEVGNQIEKWGHQNHSNGVWLLILLEEVGEVADAILKKDRDQVTAELIQCAAVIVSWLRDTKREDDVEMILSTQWMLAIIKRIGDAAKDILENRINGN